MQNPKVFLNSEIQQLSKKRDDKNGFNLTDCCKTYVDKRRVRIVYRVRHETAKAFIIAIETRGDMEIYGDAACWV